MKYRLMNKVKTIDEIELGCLYFFDATLYVYAGRAIQYGNAYAFMCGYGTFYVHEDGVKQIIERGEMYHAKAMRETKKDLEK